MIRAAWELWLVVMNTVFTWSSFQMASRSVVACSKPYLAAMCRAAAALVRADTYLSRALVLARAGPMVILAKLPAPIIAATQADSGLDGLWARVVVRASCGWPAYSRITPRVEASSEILA